MDQNREYDSWDSSGKDFSLAEQFLLYATIDRGQKRPLLFAGGTLLFLFFWKDHIEKDRHDSCQDYR